MAGPKRRQKRGGSRWRGDTRFLHNNWNFLWKTRTNWPYCMGMTRGRHLGKKGRKGEDLEGLKKGATFRSGNKGKVEKRRNGCTTEVKKQTDLFS